MSWAAPSSRSGASPPGRPRRAAIALSPITTTRSAPSVSAGLSGVFSRVPPSKVPAARPGRVLEPHGREQRRDGGRRAHVLGRQLGMDVVDAALGVARGRGALRVEHDRAARGRGGGHDRRLDDVGGGVGGQTVERDQPAHGRGQRRRVEQACRADRQPEHPAQVGETAAELGQRPQPAQDLAVVEVAPDALAFGDCLGRGLVGGRGGEGRVQRAGARAHDEARALTAALERGQQDRQRPDLVGAAGASARQDQCDRLPFRHAPTLEVARRRLTQRQSTFT